MPNNSLIDTTHKNIATFPNLMQQHQTHLYKLGLEKGATFATDLIESLERAMLANECEGFGTFQYVLRKILAEHKEKIERELKPQ